MDNVLQNLDLAKKMANIKNEVEQSAEKLLEVIKNGGCIYIAGNAGAGSNGEHFVSELVGRFYQNREALKAISLNSDNTTMTCIANDFGYEFIFARQLRALFNPEKDIFISMTTSGNSKNIIHALLVLEELNGNSINLLGGDGGNIAKIKIENETNIIIPSYNTPRIQEAHMFILHYWAEYIEKNMFGDENNDC
jgi:D-sedoheptulose 7-phosphate isomerase